MATQDSNLKRESKLGLVLLFAILLISIAAFVLAVVILAKLGSACSCDNTVQATVRKLKVVNYGNLSVLRID
ncbi:hypothetical protein AC249_AIPGENE6761 [Exaiptasia diaphana]|nr:hypothetical protein AC249_AIPGENE6761 [Exaiptasia diaphana]